jgi:hypothetical protein
MHEPYYELVVIIVTVINIIKCFRKNSTQLIYPNSHIKIRLKKGQRPQKITMDK